MLTNLFESLIISLVNSRRQESPKAPPPIRIILPGHLKIGRVTHALDSDYNAGDEIAVSTSRHMALTGSSGCGKSTLLVTLIAESLCQGGEGSIVVIDKLGDLTDVLLPYVAAFKCLYNKAVVIVDLRQQEWATPLNFLQLFPESIASAYAVVDQLSRDASDGLGIQTTQTLLGSLAALSVRPAL